MQTNRSLALVFALLQVAPAWAASPRPLRAPLGRGIVACDNAEASHAGAELLARGGNAVDAAVAAALALGVASPAGSGLGGGGFLVTYSAKERVARVLDFRETAPAAATRDMFIVEGKAVPERSRRGGLAVAVPGEPAGLAAVEARYGRLGLAAAAAPALRLARDGFVVSFYIAEAARRLAAAGAPTPSASDDALLALLAPSGKPVVEGERLRRPELARTLERFAQEGADGFYKGPVARAIVDAVRARGGILTDEDLARYRPLWREPLVGRFRGYTVYAAPPPAGGATALEALQILDARPPLTPLGAGSSAADHVIAEALKHAFADRARSLGDPAFADVPTVHLVDPAYARELAARIANGAVQRPEAYGDARLSPAPAAAPRDHGTSHLSVIDGEGNVVALTTTINLSFGARFVAGSTGVILNDEMDDFSAQPGVPNYFGLVGALANAIAPGKRPLSSMTPLVLVKDGRAALSVGGSGGPLIISETVQAIVNVVDFGMDAQAAISAPRIHAQWIPNVVIAEPEVPTDVVEGLRRRGQKVSPPEAPGGSGAQMVRVNGELLEAASDPRKGGAPAAP
jgi:gamma-glutamyltranspeptidase/glutathione hydrolase